jgi:hypothetical protein
MCPVVIFFGYLLSFVCPSLVPFESVASEVEGSSKKEEYLSFKIMQQELCKKRKL